VFIAQCCVFRANEEEMYISLRCLFVYIETERERDYKRAMERISFFKKIRVVESEKETTPEGTNIS
jgi:hypothetical protein